MSSKKMSPQALRLNNIFMAIAGLIALFFLLQDFYHSVVRSLPTMGAVGYLTGPIFIHKISELIIGGCWFFVAFMSNQENAGLWPAWMPHERYGTFLRYSAVAVSVATVMATYAWTITNLGTSPLTTDFTPLSLRPGEALVWRYYLGVLVVAGVIYTLVMGRKGLRIGWESANAA